MDVSMKFREILAISIGAYRKNKSLHFTAFIAQLSQLITVLTPTSLCSIIDRNFIPIDPRCARTETLLGILVQ